MGWVGMFASLVAMIQGIAWLGPRDRAPRPLVGGALAAVGLLAFGLSLLYLAVPGFL